MKYLVTGGCVPRMFIADIKMIQKFIWGQKVSTGEGIERVLDSLKL